MSNSEERSFWTTVPGIITAVSGLISAIGGLIVAYAALNSGDTDSSQPEATKQSARSAQVLYKEDFSDSSFSTEWTTLTGKWKVENGALNGRVNRQTSIGTPVWAITTLNQELPVDNYSVSFRTRIIKGEVSELMLHVSNNRYVRAYVYTIDQAVVLGDGKVLERNEPGSIGADKIMDYIGGGPSLSQNGFPIQKDNWYNVVVTAKDNLYTITIGGQEVVRFIDAQKKLNPRGTIGFISNGQIQFDDVMIKGVP